MAPPEALIRPPRVPWLDRLRFLTGGRLHTVAVLALLGLASSLLEGFGISLLVPFFATLSHHGAATGNRYLDWLSSELAGFAPPARMSVIGGFLLLCLVVKNLVTYSRDLYSCGLAGRVVHHLRCQVHEQVLKVSIGFLDTQDPGALGTMAGSEVFRVTACILGLSTMLSSLTCGAVFLMLLGLISGPLTAGVLGLLGLVSWGLRGLNMKVRGFGQRLSEAQTAIGHRFYDSVQGAREVRAFGQEGRHSDGYRAASDKARRLQFAVDAITYAVGPVGESLSSVVLCTVLFVVAPTLFKLDLPRLLAFSIMLYRLQPHVRLMETARSMVAANLPAADSVATFLATASRSRQTGGCRPVATLSTAVTFRGITFRYQSGRSPALDNVSFTIRAGETTALVGPSGAGKSTLAALLMRFIEPQDGTILVDDVPLPELELTAWRGSVGLVSQHVVLFTGTVAENIAYGRPDAAAEDIERAARLAHAHDFIQTLPDGYRTPVGCNGVGLSGGQRQRLALARAILVNPRVILLDEATSAVDTIAETLIQDALDTLKGSHTLIVIAHRMSTIERADHVVVLDAGRVVEDGTPARLGQTQGLYSRLYRHADGGRARQASGAAEGAL